MKTVLVIGLGLFGKHLAIRMAELLIQVIRTRFRTIIIASTVHDMVRLSALAKVLSPMA